MSLTDHVTEAWPNQFTIDTLEGKDVLSTLLRGTSFLDGVDWWLSAGTLLGLERDGGFIPHDTDIDIAVYGHWDRSRLPADEFTAIRLVEYKRYHMQSAYIHNPTNVIFDVFHYWYKGDGRMTNIQGHGWIDRSLRLVRPLFVKNYLGHDFPVPNNIDAYLTEWYGDWRTPVVGGKTEWQQ